MTTVWSLKPVRCIQAQVGTRATARVSAHPPNRSRPYNDYGGWGRRKAEGKDEGDRKGLHPASTPLPPLQ
jgi:hypothetical protein